MANIIKRVWNQNRMVQIEDLRGMTFQAEAAGHTFQISGIDDEGNTVALTGTPSGVLLRPDNTDVALTCSVSGGVVSATLPANCYDVPGRFGLTIFITSGGSKTAIYAAVGTVTRTSSGTVAPGTSQSVVDLINAINAAVNSIPASYSALLADIAPTYSNSALYSVGQYAWYDGDLKRCIVPITTAESYTAAHWTSAVLGQDVSDLKSALDSVDSVMPGLIGDQIINPANYEIGGIYIPASPPWNYEYSSKAIRTAQGFYYNVKKGDKLYLTDYTDALFNCFVENGSNYNRSGNTGSGEYTVPFDGQLRFIVKNKTEKTLTDADKNYLISLIRIKGIGGTQKQCEKNTSDISNIYARVESIDGIVNIGHSDFEVGNIYIVNGSGWSYYWNGNRVRTKEGITYQLKSGATIKLSSYNGFRFIVGYKDESNNYHSSDWQTNDYILPVNAEVVLMISRNPEVTVTDSDLTLLVNMLSINQFSTQFGRSYAGDKINAKQSYGYNWIVNYAFIPAVSVINDTYGKNVTSHQAMSAYGNYIALTYSDNVIVLLDKDWNIVSVLDAETGHGNSISFSNVFYDGSDILPLLYVITSVTADETVLKVMRFTSTSSVSTVKTIVFSGTNYGEGAINPITGLFYLLSYKTGSSSDPTNNGIIVSEYDVSGENPILLRSEDAGLFIPVIQDCEIRNGMIFVVSFGEWADTTNKIYVVSTASLGIRNILTDFDSYYESINEPEGITFLGSRLVTNAGTGVRAIDFEN